MNPLIDNEMSNDLKALKATKIIGILEKSPKSIHIEFLNFIIDLNGNLLLNTLKKSKTLGYFYIDSEDCTVDELEKMYDYIIKLYSKLKPNL